MLKKTKLSAIFHPKSTTILTEVHVWALINQTIDCLEGILRDYESQQQHQSHVDDKLILSEVENFDDIQLCDDGTVDASTFRHFPRESTILPVTGPGSVNKIIRSIGVVFYDVFSQNILKSSKQPPALLETDLDDLDGDQIRTKQINIDETDYEVDLEPELEDLFMSMLESGSESPASDKDEGYGRESPVLCVCSSTALIRVREKCLEHFDEQLKKAKHLSSHSTTTTTTTTSGSHNSVCPILRRIVANEQRITAEEYYRAVCSEMLDDFAKFVKLLNQMNDSPKRDANHNSTATNYNNNSMKITKNDLKIELKRAASVPALSDYRLSLTRASIQKRLQELKPASERQLADPRPADKCLHECLMDAVRSSDSSQLRRTHTIVKPDICELYLQEKSSTNLKRSKSLRNFSSTGFLNARQRRERASTKLNSSSTKLNTSSNKLNTSFFAETPFDPYDVMRPTVTFSRSKSTSRFSILNLISKWLNGDPQYQYDRKYKND